MDSRAAEPSTGSRTAAYLVAGGLATGPAFVVGMAHLGVPAAVGGVVTAWATGVAWLLRRRQEDPSWDRRPTTGRR